MKTKIIAITGIIMLLIVGIFLFLKNDDSSSKTQTEKTSNNSAKVLGASTAGQNSEQKGVFKKISAIKAKDLIAQSGDSLKIIDIRTSQEYLLGNIEKSINIDFYGDFEEEISKLDKNGKYLVYCKSGNRSGQALKIFEKLGYEEVYELEDGYNSWITM